jgi:hypothetical protein
MAPGAPGRAATTPAGGYGSEVDDADGPENLTLAELAAASGLSLELIRDLEAFGLLAPQRVAGTAYYDADALIVARAAAGFARHGVEARHLRSWRTAAEREASVFEQVVMPFIRQRNPDARQQAADTLEELSSLGAEMREVLLRQALRAIH